MMINLQVSFAKEPYQRDDILQKRPLTHTHAKTHSATCGYGVATISRLLRITGLFGKRALSKRGYSAK